MNTRPGELAKINALAQGDEYRVKVLTTLAVLEERSEHQASWMKEHDRRDDERFSQIDKRLGGVSSAVKTDHDKNTYTLKEMVGGFLVLCGALGALIYFIAWVIGHAGKGAP